MYSPGSRTPVEQNARRYEVWLYARPDFAHPVAEFGEFASEFLAQCWAHHLRTWLRERRWPGVFGLLLPDDAEAVRALPDLLPRVCGVDPMLVFAAARPCVAHPMGDRLPASELDRYRVDGEPEWDADLDDTVPEPVAAVAARAE